MGWKRVVLFACLAALSSCRCGGSNLSELQSQGKIVPNALDFGSVPVGSTASQTLQVINTSALALTLESAAFTGANAAEFAAPQLASTVVIDPGKSLTLAVNFTPGAVGPRSAQLAITTDSGQTPTLTASLTGTGVDVHICPAPAALNFGQVQVQGSPAIQQEVFTNCGSGATTVTVGAITGPQGGDFAVTSTNTQATLNPGDALTVSIAYQPSAVGPSSASLAWTACAACAAASPIALSGVGVDGVLTFSPNPANFPSVSVGQTASTAVTGTNTGTASITVTSLAIRNTPSAFSLPVPPAMPQTLGPGQSFTFTVSYSPSGTGLGQEYLDAVFNVADPNVPPRLATETLNGTSIEPCTTSNAPPHNFASGAIVIPMDDCYQRADANPSNQTVNCNKTADQGILRAYGLVYLLTKHNITVYWTIDPAKSSLTGPDITVASGSSSNVVTHWNWATKAWDASFFPANTQSSITYIGGPFIIDPADAPTVVSLLSNDPDFAQARTDGFVDIHQVSAAFSAKQVRPLVGPPPRIAIFNFTNGGVDQTSMEVMHSYVALAGLDTPTCAGGASGDCSGGVLPTGGCTLGGTCNGVTCGPNQFCLPRTGCLTVNSGPGKLYDVLCDNDFKPPYATSRLATGGYKLLWTPHWEDAADPTTNVPLQGVLQAISSYVSAGNNVLAECASVATLEGATGSPRASGSPLTRFQTTLGLGSNENVATTAVPTYFNFSSPNMQMGDFPFTLQSGALQDWAPSLVGGIPQAYQPGVLHFIEAPNGTDPMDIYTMSLLNNDPTKGLVVYLGGHDYSDGPGLLNPQIAGSRLVLNSLFNLGIACVP